MQPSTVAGRGAVTWAKHIHHRVLIEPLLGSLEERQDCIKATKPAREVPIRLALLAEIDWPLPEELVKAGEMYAKAFVVWYEARRDSCSEYYVANAQTEKSQCLLQAQHYYDLVLKVNIAQIEALHAQHCPNCPWDGKTIFPEKQGNVY